MANRTINFFQRLRAALMKASGTENTVLRVRAVQTDGKRYNPVNHGVSMKKLDESPYMVNLLKPHPTENNAFELLIDADTLIESLEDAGLYDTVAANFRVSGNDLVYDRVKPDGTIIQAGVTISGLFSAESDTLYGSGIPDNGIGNDGDEYLDTTSGIIYQKESGVWVVKKDLNTLDNQIASEVPFDPTGTAFDTGSTDVDKALKEAGDRVQDLETFETSATAELSDHEARIQTEEGVSVDHEARIQSNEALAHSHSNKALLDTYTQTDADLSDAVAKKHAHVNKTALDNITGSGSVEQYLSGTTEYVPIHMTLTELRAYTGNATRVQVSYNGTIGVFELDPADTTSADNTGTVVLDGKTPTAGRWKRQYKGPVELAWFGFGLDAATNHTVFSDVLTLMASDSSLTGQYGSGELILPKGNFEIEGSIESTGNTIGLIVRGQGKYATNLIFTPTSGTMFQLSTYLFPSFRDFSMLKGTISGTTMTYHTSSTAIAFKLNGTGGGFNLTQRDLLIRNFGRVVDTTSATTNEDTFVWDNCSILYNDYVWYNSNTQAVSWHWNNCDIKHTKSEVFHNPGGALQVRGGTSINPGKYIVVTAVNYALVQCVIDGVKFETYQNIDASTNPYWLYVTSSASAVNVKFSNCSSTGGGSIAAKYTVFVEGMFNVIFDNCEMGGIMKLHANVSSSDSTGKVSFINCDYTPEIEQQTEASQGNTAASIYYVNSIPYGFTKPITAGFTRQVTNNRTESLNVTQRQETLYFKKTISSSTTETKEFNVFIAPGFSLNIRSAWIYYNDNAGVSVTLNVWKDSSKTDQLFTWTKPTATSGNKFAVPTVTPFPVNIFAASNAPLYLEVVTAGNAGSVTIRIILDVIVI